MTSRAGYVRDGASNQWVSFTGPPGVVQAIPVGTVIANASSVVPSGDWLLCNGQAVSRTTYANLFAAIGTTYGVGDGSTTFNLPDLRGRVIVASDSTQTEFDTLGETGGAKSVTLAEANLPSHTHGAGTYGVSGTGAVNTAGHNADHAHNTGSGDHNHNSYYLTRMSSGAYDALRPANSGSNTGNVQGTTSTGPHGHNMSGVTSDHSHRYDHGHGFSGTSGATGSGTAHQNLQPYLVMNYIIKF